MRVVYVITGRPGIGKSTLFGKIIERITGKGLIVGGIRTPEIRGPDGRRLGFKIIDLSTGRETWLARRNCSSHIRVGSYCVLEEASDFIREALERALRGSQVIGIDEVGPMELKLRGFKETLLRILDSDVSLILVIHYRLRDRDILDRIRGAKRVYLDMSNRDHYLTLLPDRIAGELAGTYGS